MRTATSLVALLAACLLGMGAVVVRNEAPAEAPPPNRPADDIPFYEARVARDPNGARDRAVLASLYLARGQAGGSEHDLERAETLARRSLALRGRRNDDAAAILAGVLMTRHQFAEAYDIMARAVAADSSSAVKRATLGEIALELGRYDEADGLFRSVALARYQPEVGVRYARWLEINGHSGEARLLFESIRAKLASGFRVSPRQLAWLDLRMGELAARNGRADIARQAFERGNRLEPEEPHLLATQARLLADRGDVRDATDLAERSLALRFDPGTLALLVEMSEAGGDTAQAGQYLRAMEVAVSGTGSLHRAWGLFLLDRGRRTDEILRRAMTDLGSRRDVYGYDLAAWALFKAGRIAEARPFADSAVSRGTEDPALYSRAAEIALAAGDTALALSRAKRAHRINPRFPRVPGHNQPPRST